MSGEDNGVATRHFHGIVSRFSAGGKSSPSLPPDLVASLKELRDGETKLHGSGVNLSAQDMQNLIGLLRHRGIEVFLDRLLSTSGAPLAVFTQAALESRAIIAVAAAANQAPAGKKVIDCEGYAYLSQQL